MEDGPGASFMVANVVNTRGLEIKTSDMSIRISSDKIYLVKNRMIGEQLCTVIVISEHVEIDGITVHPAAASKGDEDENMSFQDMSEQTGIESRRQRGQIQKSLS